MARGPYKRERRNFEKTPAKILGHPLRVRLLQIVNERDISPAAFIRERLAGNLLDHLGNREAVSHIAYHFRQLEEWGCVEVVERTPRRGSVQNVYRGVARRYSGFDENEWRSLSPERRRQIRSVCLLGVMARAQGAISDGALGSDEGGLLGWIDLHLDDQGWMEFSELCVAMRTSIEVLRETVETRLDGSGSGTVDARGTTVKTATWAMLAFEAFS